MNKPKIHSPDRTQNNIARIRELFPGCVTEAEDANGELKLAVDFDQLKQELSYSIVEGTQERYRLEWPGKRAALLAANTPVNKTLLPQRQESINFNQTKNIFIDGDNLEALKIIQETYFNKIRMIYIDPPYNTGNDFIYNDDFSSSEEEYALASNQTDQEKNRLIINKDTDGRYHSKWLSMILPRIRLAKNLLKEEGCIFISIDDREVANLRKVCDEVFGSQNFIADIIWQSRTSISDDHEISLNHNHTIAYAKSYKNLKFYGEEIDESEYQNRDNDPRGPWKLVPLDANKPGGNTMYPITNPKTGEKHWPPQGRSWSINPQEYKKLFDDNRIAFGINGDSAPKKKLFIKERLEKGETKTPSSILLDAGTTKDGSSEIERIFGKKKVFGYPKPTSLIRRLIQYASYKEKNVIIMDFFAGSSTTAHAVLKMNAEDGKNRRFIMIQLPEPIENNTQTHENKFNNIAQLSKERIRLAGNHISHEGDHHPNWDHDIGFRSFKVSSSCFNPVYTNPEQSSQTKDKLFTDNIKPDRTPEDLLFQVMLDWGVDLSLPIATETIQGKEVFFVDGNALVACFDAAGGVDEALVKALASREPLRVVFRDAGFRDSAAKINVEQVFKLLSPATDVRCI